MKVNPISQSETMPSPAVKCKARKANAISIARTPDAIARDFPADVPPTPPSM